MRSNLLWAGALLVAGSVPLGAQSGTMASGTAAAPASSLTLAGPGQQTTLSLEALKALPHVTVSVTDAHSHMKQTYAGVSLISLLEKVGAPAPEAVRGKVLAEYVLATGSDNYRAVLALAEIEPGFHPGGVIVADTLDGKPIDTQQGPLKLIVEEDEKPARWVRNLVKVELKSGD